MRLNVEHVTVYHYDAPVRSVIQSHRLMPTRFEGQTVLEWNVDVSGGISGGRFVDGAGDVVHGWTVPGPVQDVRVQVAGTVETVDLSGVLRGHREIIRPAAYLRERPPTRADAALTELARGVTLSGDGLATAHALAEVIADSIAYRPGVTHAHTTAAEALSLGEGVCQDHAHALIACARVLGIPARYVSGYLHATSDGTPHEAAHAWAELFVDSLGWVGFDAANRCCPDARYIRLGSGRDAHEAAPIRGIARGVASETLDVTVSILDAQQ